MISKDDIRKQGMDSKEQVIDELRQALVNYWDAVEDWGDDPFTEMMCEEVTREEYAQRIKVFEATCYYVIQQLMYGETGKEMLQKLIAVRGDIKC